MTDSDAVYDPQQDGCLRKDESIFANNRIADKVPLSADEAENIPPAAKSDPNELRKGTAPWRLPCSQVNVARQVGGYNREPKPAHISYLGYDVSNIANIQAPIYEAFGHVETLPWVALCYSLSCVAATPLIRCILDLGNIRITVVAFFIVYIVSCAVAGSANSMVVIIVGRALTAVGNTGVYQLNLNIVSLFYDPADASRIAGMVGLSWAVGLVLGPFVGGAFAENQQTTWRWAFYIIIPFLGLLMCMAILLLPNYNARRGSSMQKSLREVDWVGGILHMALSVLFAIALLLSGSTWSWSSSSAIAVWVVMGITFIVYTVQQYLALLTSAQLRAFPVLALKHRTAGLAALAATCVSMGYAVPLYYLPLFFSFARSATPIQAAVHVIPFIGVFIISVVLSSIAMPKIGYYAPFYIVAGSLMVVSGTLMAQITPTTHDGAILGFEALLGVGVGLVYTNSYSIANASLHDSNARLAGAALFNIASLGGTALSLCLAGCIYQNIGFQYLSPVLQPFGFKEEDIREALAGVASPIFETKDPIVLDTVIQNITRVIARLFYIIVAAGVVCILLGLCMRWEKLDFKRLPEDDGGDIVAVANSQGGRSRNE